MHPNLSGRQNGKTKVFLIAGFLGSGKTTLLKRILSWQVFRIKGPVQFRDRTVLLNFVAGQWCWDTWEGKPETRLVLVGWEIEAEKIMPDLEKCVGLI